MNELNNTYGSRSGQQSMNQYMTRTFGWMFLGLGITFVVAIATALTGLYVSLFSTGIIFAITIAELVLVIVLGAKLKTLSTTAATSLFLAYAALNGLMFSTYFVVYDLGTLIFAFLAAALYFGIMAVYGWVTKKDLSGWGPKLFSGLIALLIVSVIGLFFSFGVFDIVLCAVGLIIFMAYTAYDTQKIKAYYYSTNGEGEMAAKMSIYSALELYLDFINLFLYILRLLGRNNSRK